jgi:hypothetical protein
MTTHSKIEMAMAVETLDTLGFAVEPETLDQLIQCYGWQDHEWWIRGAASYHRGVSPNPSGEAWTRDEATTWQQGWDFAFARDPYAADAWPDYEAPKLPIRMRNSLSGLIRNAGAAIEGEQGDYYRHGLGELKKHLREMKRRFEVGDHDVVAEFFDLYTVGE